LYVALATGPTGTFSIVVNVFNPREGTRTPFARVVPPLRTPVPNVFEAVTVPTDAKLEVVKFKPTPIFAVETAPEITALTYCWKSAEIDSSANPITVAATLFVLE